MSDHVTVRGFVATDPRSTTLPNGTAVTSFRMATTERWQNRDGTWTDGHTNWYSVVAYRTLANNVSPSVHKGDKILVQGRLKFKTFVRKDGSNGSVAEIEADSIGHDLTWGTTHFNRITRQNSASASPTLTPSAPDTFTSAPDSNTPTFTAADPNGAVAPVKFDGETTLELNQSLNTETGEIFSPELSGNSTSPILSPTSGANHFIQDELEPGDGDFDELEDSEAEDPAQEDAFLKSA